MSRKNKEIPGTIKKYAVYEQRIPTQRKGRLGETVYDACLVKVGEIEATHSGAALDIAKARKMAPHPVIWGPDIEAKREIYKRRQQEEEIN